MQIKSFIFNPFSENTYILYDDSKACVVVDPGCAFPDEEAELSQFISDNNLIVKNVILTHAHVDHIFGCDYVCKKYGVGITMHKEDLFMLERGPQIGQMYGFVVKESPAPEAYLDHGDSFSFGNTTLEIVHTPGHSPGSISFIHKPSKSVISGDVLFQGSIGRTDLPGGNMEVLLNAIRTQLFPLGDDFEVYSGHGDVTTIASEKRFNPFLR
jgi:hydroxyacylglutathione hydrolase